MKLLEGGMVFDSQNQNQPIKNNSNSDLNQIQQPIQTASNYPQTPVNSEGGLMPEELTFAQIQPPTKKKSHLIIILIAILLLILFIVGASVVAYYSYSSKQGSVTKQVEQNEQSKTKEALSSRKSTNESDAALLAAIRPKVSTPTKYFTISYDNNLWVVSNDLSTKKQITTDGDINNATYIVDHPTRPITYYGNDNNSGYLLDLNTLESYPIAGSSEQCNNGWFENGNLFLECQKEGPNNQYTYSITTYDSKGKQISHRDISYDIYTTLDFCAIENKLVASSNMSGSYHFYNIEENGAIKEVASIEVPEEYTLNYACPSIYQGKLLIYREPFRDFSLKTKVFDLDFTSGKFSDIGELSGGVDRDEYPDRSANYEYSVECDKLNEKNPEDMTEQEYYNWQLNYDKVTTTCRVIKSNQSVLAFEVLAHQLMTEISSFPEDHYFFYIDKEGTGKVIDLETNKSITLGS